ncbi:MAG: hypothetical protein OHK0028_22610 [Deltaproteobacteria bacterium]
MERITLTEHARVRLNSRRIPAEAVEMALLFGREVHAKGATFYAIGRREVDRFEESGIDLKGYEGIQVICAEDHVVVTAYRNRDFSNLRLRRPKKRSGRQRGRHFGPRIHQVAA